MALLLLSLGAPAGMASAEQQADRHPEKAGQCVACHGVDGVSPNPLFPHLAGQPAGYLQRQLEAFRNGDRYHPLMTPVAESLDTGEMEVLAQHFSRLGPLAARSGVEASRGN